MLEFRCTCGNRVRLEEGHLGRAVACAACKRVLRVIVPNGPGKLGLRGKLLIHAGPRRVGELLFLGGDVPLTIGKLPGSDITLQGSLVSRTHCRLVPDSTGWTLEDQQSTNGVFVNRTRVAEQRLRNGDRVQIGDYEFKYHGPDPAKAWRQQSKHAAAPTRTAARVAAEAAGAAAGTPAAAKGPARTTPRPRKTPAPAVAKPAQPAEDGILAMADNEADDLYNLAPAGEVVDVPHSSEASATISALDRPDEADAEAGPTCPSCKRTLPTGARICVQCGINLRTGRAILTSQDNSLDNAYILAESVLRWLSWLIWFGVYPIASEALGRCKPLVIRTLAIVTILTSFGFLFYEWTGSPRMRELKNYMHWAGEADPGPDAIFLFYGMTSYGDSEAFWQRYSDLEYERPDFSPDELLVAAHQALPPDQQYQGEYRPAQLLTSAFLHGGILHLAGNLLFLVVLGSRINALLGHVVTLLLYPVLAVAAALAHMASMTAEPPMPALGASGAIMGLAGLYFVFFPVHKVHVAAWMRLGLLFRFRLHLAIWAVRGFWVVLFYIAFDVIYTVAGIETGTAHWAHLGGFIAGAAIGLVLLLTRTVNCQGGDIISAILGRYAWALVGRPRSEPGLLQRLP